MTIPNSKPKQTTEIFSVRMRPGMHAGVGAIGRRLLRRGLAGAE
jgi:hypothetical protein